MPYRWEPTAGVSGRYRDERGRFVSSSTVRRELDRYLDTADPAKALAEALRGRQLSVADWEVAMRRHVKNTHLNAIAMERGGWANMTPADYGRAGQIIREQYGYLKGFANDIASGKQRLDGTLGVRAKLYTQAGRETFYRSKQANLQPGIDMVMSVRHARDSCAECIALEGKWFKVGDPAYKLPGQRICMKSCRCYERYGRMTADGVEAIVEGDTSRVSAIATRPDGDGENREGAKSQRGLASGGWGSHEEAKSWILDNILEQPDWNWIQKQRDPERAKQMALEMLGKKVEIDGIPLDIVERFARAVKDMQDRYGAPKLTFFRNYIESPFETKSSGIFAVSDRRVTLPGLTPTPNAGVHISREFFRALRKDGLDLDTYITRAHADGWLAPKDIDGMIRHEMAHYYQAAKMSEEFDQNINLLYQAGKDIGIFPRVSRYGSTSATEFYAELTARAFDNETETGGDDGFSGYGRFSELWSLVKKK